MFGSIFFCFLGNLHEHCVLLFFFFSVVVFNFLTSVTVRYMRFLLSFLSALVTFLGVTINKLSRQKTGDPRKTTFFCLKLQLELLYFLRNSCFISYTSQNMGLPEDLQLQNDQKKDMDWHYRPCGKGRVTSFNHISQGQAPRL